MHNKKTNKNKKPPINPIKKPNKGKNNNNKDIKFATKRKPSEYFKNDSPLKIPPPPKPNYNFQSQTKRLLVKNQHYK
jgi:hypothetical protein